MKSWSSICFTGVAFLGLQPILNIFLPVKNLTPQLQILWTISVAPSLLKEGGAHADVACGLRQCYTATADLTATDLGTTGTGAIGGLPVDLTGATLKVTVRVERDLPNHLAGVTAVLSMPNGSALTVELAASKWDEPVSITAPPADQVKPTK